MSQQDMQACWWTERHWAWLDAGVRPCDLGRMHIMEAAAGRQDPILLQVKIMLHVP